MMVTLKPTLKIFDALGCAALREVAQQKSNNALF